VCEDVRNLSLMAVERFANVCELSKGDFLTEEADTGMSVHNPLGKPINWEPTNELVSP
jgi:hypothetical protein